MLCNLTHQIQPFLQSLTRHHKHLMPSQFDGSSEKLLTAASSGSEFGASPHHMYTGGYTPTAVTMNPSDQSSWPFSPSSGRPSPSTTPTPPPIMAPRRTMMKHSPAANIVPQVCMVWKQDGWSSVPSRGYQSVYSMFTECIKSVYRMFSYNTYRLDYLL